MLRAGCALGALPRQCTLETGCVQLSACRIVTNPSIQHLCDPWPIQHMGTATELYLAKTPSLLALLIPLLTFAFLHHCPLNRFLGSCANLSMGCVIGEIGTTDGTIESIPPYFQASSQRRSANPIHQQRLVGLQTCPFTGQKNYPCLISAWP